jgi:hypothetical protein
MKFPTLNITNIDNKKSKNMDIICKLHNLSPTLATWFQDIVNHWHFTKKNLIVGSMMANGWMDFIYLNTLMHVGFQLCQNYFSFLEPKIQMTNFFLKN